MYGNLDVDGFRLTIALELPNHPHILQLFLRIRAAHPYPWSTGSDTRANDKLDRKKGGKIACGSIGIGPGSTTVRGRGHRPASGSSESASCHRTSTATRSRTSHSRQLRLVRLVYNSSFSVGFFSRNNIFLS
jgi:hypothetical protein